MFLKDNNGAKIDFNKYSMPLITDWNNDGLLDLILGRIDGGEWRIYLNSGTPTDYTFTGYTVLKTNGDIKISNYSIKFVDFDKDGKKDLICPSENITPGDIITLSSVEVADQNGDGFGDLIFCCGNQMMCTLIKPFIVSVADNEIKVTSKNC